MTNRTGGSTAAPPVERPSRAEPAEDRIGRGKGDGSLTRRTASGLRWSYGAAAVNAVLQIAYVASMSRLLTPTAFGIMAMSQIIVNFGLYFSRMGVVQSLIQRDDTTEKDVRFCATTSLLIGAGVAALFFVLAPSVGSFYDEPGVVPVVRALSATFVLLGLGVTSAGLLRRQMRFRELAAIDVATSVAAMATGVTAAVLGAGVWSLVAATLASNGLATLLQFGRARHSLRPLFSAPHGRALYSAGARFSVLRLTEFVGRNLDTITVGRYLGSGITGVYSRVYTLVQLPLSQYLSLALGKVLFPSFAAIQSDRERLRRTIAGVLLLASLVLIPAGAGMAVAGPELVGVVLGTRFADGGVLVPFFAASAVLYVLSHIAQLLCEAIAELNRTIAVQVASTVALLLMLIAVSGSDLWAFAAVLAVAEALRHAAYMVLLRRAVGLRPRDLVSAYVPSVSAAVVVAGAVALARHLLLGAGAPAGVALVGEVALGGIVLLACIRFLPFPWMRQELQTRLRAMGVLRRQHGALSGLVRLVVGPLPTPAAS